jgi:hypothetical protein
VKGREAKWLSITSGGGPSTFYADVARELGDTPNLPKLVELLAQHGVKPAPPPPQK